MYTKALLIRLSRFYAAAFEQAKDNINLKRADVIWVTFGGNNAGDYYSNPALYFDLSPLRSHTISWKTLGHLFLNDALPKRIPIIIAGGGAFGASSHRERIVSAISGKHPVYSWGAGSNRPIQANVKRRLNPDEVDAPETNFESFKLVGLRDFPSEVPPEGVTNVRYVPCASAMLPLFDQQWQVARDIGVVNHASLAESFPYEIDNKLPAISMDLRHNKIDEIIKFIGSSKVIFTTSYHAAYWAALMGKRSVTPAHISSKFGLLEYPPVVASQSLEKDAVKANKEVPSSYLVNCRERNISFHNAILEAL